MGASAPVFVILLVIVPFRTLATRYFPKVLGIVVAVTSNPLLLPLLVTWTDPTMSRASPNI